MLQARIVRSARELEAHLRTRRVVFESSWMAGHCRFERGLEVDGWDRRAQHLGIWTDDGHIVGCIRAVGQREIPESVAWMRELGVDPPAVSPRLPALADFFPDGPGPLGDERGCWEISRFGLLPGYRGADLARWLAWTGCGFLLGLSGTRPFVFRVPQHDVSAYRALVGARQVPAETRIHHGRPVGLLTVREAGVCAPWAARIFALRDALWAHGKASWPAGTEGARRSPARRISGSR